MSQQLYYLLGYVVVLGSLTALTITGHVPAETIIAASGLILGHIGGVYTPSPLSQPGTPKVGAAG